MVEYRKNAHSVWDVKFHVIWVTKYRYKVLRGEVATRTRDLLRQICQGRDVVIVQGAVSPDHVHMLVSVPPQLKKRYWGQHLWARGYFCASVGAVDEDTIRRYIENQQWDDPGENFKITAPTEP